MFERNREIDKYLNARGKVILNACPGSGKTTSIAYKLQTLTKEITDKNSAFSGVACLSFTNIAKDEINQKYKSFSGNNIRFPHIVSTIDSFINQYIVLPHYHLLYSNVKRPIILDNSYILDDFNLNFLFQYKIGNKRIKFIYPPSSIQLTKERTFLTNGNKPNLAPNDYKIFHKYCIALKNWQFKNGFLTNNDTSYIALKLLDKFPQIGKFLIKRFPLIILDEAQDTSEIHFAIFDKLIELGLENIEIIGDPYQSLYEWREARPDLFIKRYKDTQNWFVCDYTFCRRSEQNIINTYSILRNINKPIYSTHKQISNKVTIIKYETNNEIKAVEKFIEIAEQYKNIKIVVRGRNLLNKLLGFNNKKDFWKSNIPKSLILAKQELQMNENKNAVNRTRKIIIQILEPSLNYDERKKIEIEIKNDYQLNSNIIKFLNGLPEFDLSLQEWTSKTEKYITIFFKLDTAIELELKQKQGKKIYESSIASLFNTENSDNNFPISTIHQIKGKTFDALMVFLGKNSKGQSISLNDYTKPTDFPNESKRMIYVAMSRPKKLLAIAVPYETKNEKLKELFGTDIIIYE